MLRASLSETSGYYYYYYYYYKPTGDRNNDAIMRLIELWADIENEK